MFYYSGFFRAIWSNIISEKNEEKINIAVFFACRSFAVSRNTRKKMESGTLLEVLSHKATSLRH